jgi:hypothetical protein
MNVSKHVPGGTIGYDFEVTARRAEIGRNERGRHRRAIFEVSGRIWRTGLGSRLGKPQDRSTTRRVGTGASPKEGGPAPRAAGWRSRGLKRLEGLQIVLIGTLQLRPKRVNGLT